ncbi:transcriptional regulator, DeoR family [Agrilactobacillus composti DSM 18527 = JCM 14202]|uniref:Transcriptional regulator, DeoR family n=1 Tax=Agrilactobacillus composti DSM 18527 = JCM 14202 TaxID=1423734 RepID=A0A0R1XQY3_9LACO|nr:sugar-binding transcriptional regulator [Agrilactobacillus composti]KRM30411.1 transcriptional regulator, DeoR family [Agrilactobacillus composti DSM 18527 = JCM 14202]
MQFTFSSKNETKKIRQILDISRYYYIDGLSQLEISKKMALSRPTVSRLLQQAKETGIVEIKINDPFQDINSLKEQLKKKYGLKEVIIALQTSNDLETIYDALGEEAARYLDKIVKNNDIIGISWGLTMKAIANHLTESQKDNVKIVQLKGSVANSQENNYSIDITSSFNKAFHTQSQILPLPVIFDNAKTKELVTKDHFIQSVIQEGYSANIALFTVGTTRPSAMLFRLGYLDQQHIDDLRKKSVGDVLSRFITSTGEIADPELDKRTVGLPLDKLHEKPYSILTAGGESKLHSIHAALLGGYANVLITDQNVAQKLLDL